MIAIIVFTYLLKGSQNFLPLTEVSEQESQRPGHQRGRRALRAQLKQDAEDHSPAALVQV